MTGILDAHRQTDHALRLDWGPTGADAIVPGCDLAVVVDVLSFTTTLSVAADRGTAVYPHARADAAAGPGAVLAVGRSVGTGVSLSPGSVRAADRLERLVLPSPNGSTISARLSGAGAEVVGESLRNRTAAAAWLLRRRAADPGLRVAVVAAGERWPGGGGLRPAVEDLWGAGALVAALLTGGWTGASPEALAAAAAFTAVADDVRGALLACASGRELVAIGFADDVEIAAELDHSSAVPVLRGPAFVPAS